MRFLLISCLTFLILGSLASCEKGSPLGNMPPETRIFLDDIALTGPDRLNSVVQLHWSGEDEDGFVTGFELSFDNVNWAAVQTQDSTFRFDLLPGSDTTDIDFYVRALDNEETRDPTPAYLRIPIKNEPPVALLDTIKTIPDTVISVFATLWSVEDIDGENTLDSVFVRMNNGPWVPLPSTARFLTVVPSEPTQSGSQTAVLYVGAENQPQTAVMEDLRVGGDNQLYLRARDIAGTFSEIDTSASFYIRQQFSDLLVIDDHSVPAADATLLPAINSTYGSYDLWELSTNIPPFWDPVFFRTLSLYDKVLWYSDGAERSDFGLQLFLEIASSPLQLYLNQGGKLLVSTKFPPSFTGLKNGISPLFGFSPMDSLSSSSGQARIGVGAELTPTNNFTGYPLLENTTFLIGASPFYSKEPSNDIYEADITRAAGWVGPSTVASRTLGTTGLTNQVFFSVELHTLTGVPASLEVLLDKVLNDELSW